MVAVRMETVDIQGSSAKMKNTLLDDINSAACTMSDHGRLSHIADVLDEAYIEIEALREELASAEEHIRLLEERLA
jgi:bacterioferritin (cytochrome b1)